MAIAAGAADKTMGEMADGVIRASRFEGAKQAYLPSVGKRSHAANLLSLHNGDLLCFWFTGRGRKLRCVHRHVAIGAWLIQMELPRNSRAAFTLVGSKPRAIPGSKWKTLAISYIAASGKGSDDGHRICSHLK